VFPAALLLLVVAFLRLMASNRWFRLRPIQARWRRLEPHVVSHVRSAPGTYVYLFVLLITTWVLETSNAAVDRRLLLERSTNLHQLSRDPLRVLFSSAFWVSGVWQLVLWLALFTALVAPVERWLGTTRTAAVFFIGHVGATLLTAGGLWVALRLDLVESSVANSRDVGASYGFFAVAALLAYRVHGRRRLAYVAGLGAFIAVELAVSPSFTGFGHLLALTIGLASYPLIPSGRATRGTRKGGSRHPPRGRDGSSRSPSLRPMADLVGSLQDRGRLRESPTKGDDDVRTRSVGQGSGADTHRRS
jgi:hypothetical protein